MQKSLTADLVYNETSIAQENEKKIQEVVNVLMEIYNEKCQELQDQSKIKSLLVSIAIPLVVGGLSSLITGDGFKNYSEVTQPALSPPSWLFPIVWTLIYIMMGIAAYLIYESGHESSKKALTLYVIQLAINFIWPIFFFGFDAYLFAFILIIILWIFVLLTTISFYKINKTSGILMIPYVLWLTFAAYLNLGVYLLN